MSNHNDQHGEIDPSKFYVIPQQDLRLSNFDSHDEWILDIGGGGEGIIGMLKGRNTIAIDRIKEELASTKNDSLKIIMDAKNLQFLDSSFSYVTAFFAFMYVPEKDFDAIFSEVWRVMKPGGELLIWEPIFAIPPEERSKRLAVIFLKIYLPNGIVNETGYGGVLRDQNVDTIIEPAEKVGFKVFKKEINEHHFFIKFKKPLLNT